MDSITLRIIEGPDQGRICSDLPLPITVGREENNTIELHDERVSRSHLRIMEDNDQTLLVDLGSSNGTRVNGNIVQFYALSPGDLISIGQTHILFGSRQEISQRLQSIKIRAKEDHSFYPNISNLKDEVLPDQVKAALWERTFMAAVREANFTDEDIQFLRGSFPPKFPEALSPSQIAAFTKFLGYFSYRFRGLLNDIQANLEEQKLASDLKSSSASRKGFFRKKTTEPKEELPTSKTGINISLCEYQNLLDVAALLSTYLGDLVRDTQWDQPSSSRIRELNRKGSEESA
ncbi:MAG: FHA domain-containing protein [Planctomycetia bacterium]|nr:FHA domain-containing protein [Planctomycetia bacterium]